MFRLFLFAACGALLFAQPVKVEIFEKLNATQLLAPPSDAVPEIGRASCRERV